MEQTDQISERSYHAKRVIKMYDLQTARELCMTSYRRLAELLTPT